MLRNDHTKMRDSNVLTILVLHSFLLLIWLVSVVAGEYCLCPSKMVFVYSAINIAQASILIYLDQVESASGFTGAGLFYFSSAFFGALLPGIAMAYGYRFVIDESDLDYVEKLVKMVFVFNWMFFIGHKVGASRLMLRGYSLKGGRNKVLLIAAVAFVIGLSAMLVFSRFASLAMTGGDYVEIGVSIRGMGWLIRLAEFVAVSGVLVFILGVGCRRKDLMVAGVLCIAVFALFRFPLQNRENIVKYFIILLLAVSLYKSVAWSGIKLILFYLLFAGGLLLLPLTTSIRAHNESGNMLSMYKYYLVRDLNFSEVSSAIMSKVDSGMSLGIVDSIVGVLSIVIPRKIWENKPYPVSVELTSWVTNVDVYDVTNPSFSYAPMYIGFGYAVGGVAMVMLLAGASGFIIGRLYLKTRRAVGIDRVVTATLSALIVYYLAFSFHKLDPSLILSAVFLPAIYLYLSGLIFRFRL